MKAYLKYLACFSLGLVAANLGISFTAMPTPHPLPVKSRLAPSWRCEEMKSPLLVPASKFKPQPFGILSTQTYDLFLLIGKKQNSQIFTFSRGTKILPTTNQFFSICISSNLIPFAILGLERGYLSITDATRQPFNNVKRLTQLPIKASQTPFESIEIIESYP